MTCYKIRNKIATWFNARNICLQEERSDLAIFENGDLFLTSEWRHPGQYWIGLRKESWTWTNDEGKEASKSSSSPSSSPSSSASSLPLHPLLILFLLLILLLIILLLINSGLSQADQLRARRVEIPLIEQEAIYLLLKKSNRGFFRRFFCQISGLNPAQD